MLTETHVPNVDRLVSIDIPKNPIKLEPRGQQTKPLTVTELFSVLRHVLQALVVLHAAKGGCWMHRDIRWLYVIRRRSTSSSHGEDVEVVGSAAWFLIDFSDAAPSPQAIHSDRHFSTEEHAPELFAGTGAHNTAVDLWSVGYLISTSGDNVYTEWYQETERVQFVEQLVQSDPSKRPTAVEALQEVVRLEQQYMTQLKVIAAQTDQEMKRRKLATI